MSSDLMLLTAVEDGRIGRQALRVYAVLWRNLDVVEYRYAKLAWLRARTGLREDVISAILKRLGQLGYLDRGPDESAGHGGRRRKTYRLTVSCPIQPHTETTQPAA